LNVFSRRPAAPLQKLAELSEAERLRLALAATGDVVYEWTPGDGRILWSSDPSAHLGLGDLSIYETDKGFHGLIEDSAAEARLRLVLSPPAEGHPFHFEYALKSAGAPVWVEDCGVCLPGPSGQAERVIGTVRNITERKLREETLSWAASYDEMTGHLNRLRLREQLAQHLEQVPTAERKPAAYFVAAIDDLAVINETYGFDTADEAIVAIGRRLAEVAGVNSVIGERRATNSVWSAVHRRSLERAAFRRLRARA
jgi:hypothetical protein